MALEVALPKSKALTLSSLAKHDDIITDALVDRVSSRILLVLFQFHIDSCSY